MQFTHSHNIVYDFLIANSKALIPEVEMFSVERHLTQSHRELAVNVRELEFCCVAWSIFFIIIFCLLNEDDNIII